MRSPRKILMFSIFSVGIISYFLLTTPSDKQVVQSFEALFSLLESTGVTAYRNQDWCQVLAYNDKAYSNTDQSTCIFVTNLKPSTFSQEAMTKLKEINDILSGAKIPVRSVENIQTINRKFTYIEFHKDCFCRTRYIFNPGYKNLPTDIPNELQHFAIDRNWYRVEEDWN